MREEAIIAWLQDGFHLANKIIGLIPSRRERIATAALAGLLADPGVPPGSTVAASMALAAADALIAELDKVQA